MVLSMVFAGGLSLTAQETASSNNFFQNLEYGVLAGLNLSGLQGDVDPSSTMRFDWHVGAIISKPINDTFHIQVEPTYSREGSGVSNGSGAWRIGYFNLPILARIYAIDSWSFEAGAKIAIKISETGLGRNSRNNSNRYKPVWPGLVVGTHYLFNSNWGAQFRFNYSPSDLVKANAGDTEGTSSIVFQFSAIYLFN